MTTKLNEIFLMHDFAVCIYNIVADGNERWWLENIEIGKIYMWAHVLVKCFEAIFTQEHEGVHQTVSSLSLFPSQPHHYSLALFRYDMLLFLRSFASLTKMSIYLLTNVYVGFNTRRFILR